MIITRKRLNKVLRYLEEDSADQNKASGETPEARKEDYFWRCGNANAVNYIRYKLDLRREAHEHGILFRTHCK